MNAPSPTLPAGRPVWRPVRLVVLGLAQALGLIATAWLVNGVDVTGFWTAVVVIAVLSVVNALIWPLAIRLTAPLIAWTVGLFTFVLNGLAVQLVAATVDGFETSSFWWALAVSIVVTTVNVLVGGLLHLDDDHVWRSRVVRRLAARRGEVVETEVPGVLFVQIDGLGADVLRDAMASGHAPTLAALVDGGSHRLLDWECDLSSQTGAMQAGILLGDNTDMPAFRWFEKDTGRVMVSNRAGDAAEIERRRSTGEGLLADGGVSRANVFSGDAADSMLTFSRLHDRSGARDRLSYVVATPYTLTRIIVLSIVEIVRELREARRARRRDVRPRMHRGGSYPFLRAGATVALTELTEAMLVADVLRGVPSAYVDLVGYDEVAHHSGIRSSDALDTLRRTDHRLRRLLTVLADAPRPYHLVVLSDHGQTQGATFAQRHGETLADVIRRLARRSVDAPVEAAEGWHNLNGMLSDVAATDSSVGRTVRRATRGHVVDGDVRLGPDARVDDTPDGDVVVLASGNLGLVSFTTSPGRATRQELDTLCPGLVAGLADHPGVGFVMVRDDVEGDVVVGRAGRMRLRDGDVEGVDPLAPFGPNAADHLRRTASFANCPDLLVNGTYDPVTDDGCAFEELIGFHGGLGGAQAAPFVLAPTGFAAPDAPIVGARAVHELFAGWLRQVADARPTVDA